MRRLREFFTFREPDNSMPSAVLEPIQPRELDSRLVTTRTDATALATMEAHSQEPGDYPADIVPGEALAYETADGVYVEGGIYTLGSTPLFIARRVIEMTGNNHVSKAVRDVSRSIAADQRGEWFEHVYPLERPHVPDALQKELMPLIKYAQKSGSFFVGAAVEGSYVVMPATLDKRAHNNGVSERYAEYANLTNMCGQLATQAMFFIDPGEDSGFKVHRDSQELGLMDSALPYGQLQYDVDPLGIDCDMIEQRWVRGVEKKYAVAVEAQSVNTHFDPEWELDNEGPAEEVLTSRTHATPATSWQLKPR